MSNTIKTKYDTGYSCIAYSERQIVNVMSKKHSKQSPLSIKIVNCMQLELGRNIEEYIQVLNDTRIPISIYKFFEDGALSQYIMVRLGTGEVKDTNIAYIVCSNKRIMSISLNSDVLSNANFRRYVGISLIMQTSLEGNSVDEYRHKLSTILGIPQNKIGLSGDKSNIYANIAVGKVKIKYTFVKKPNNDFYRIASVSLEENS